MIETFCDIPLNISAICLITRISFNDHTFEILTNELAIEILLHKLTAFTTTFLKLTAYLPKVVVQW